MRYQWNLLREQSEMIHKMIDCIKGLVKDQYCKTTASPLELKDSQSGMKVSITGLPKNGLMICLPKGGHSELVEDKAEGTAYNYKQSCDKLILIPANGDINAYLIEMKTTFSFNKSSRNVKACNQIGTVPILDWFQWSNSILESNAELTNILRLLPKKECQDWIKEK